MIGHLYTLVLVGKFQPQAPVIVGSLAGRTSSQQVARAASLDTKKRITNRQTAVRR